VKYCLKRYGPLTASLVVLFASGLAAGYRWGRHSVASASSVPFIVETVEVSADQWIENAASALQKDLALSDDQIGRVRSAMAAPAQGMFTEKRQASFKIHLRLLEAHDTLAREAGLSDKQVALLKVRREQLRRHIVEKFQDIIGNNPHPVLSAL
jgi:hypothetical protein